MMRRPLRPIVECARVNVTRITLSEGAGTEEDPFRHVIYWYADDGTPIARFDTLEDS